MSDVPAIIAALGGVVTAVGVILVGYWAYRAKERAADAAEAAAKAAAEANAARSEIMVVGDKIVEVGKALDGRLSELLREARATARAEGMAAGEQAQRDRAAPSDSGK